jgi:hypothetical protein
MTPAIVFWVLVGAFFAWRGVKALSTYRRYRDWHQSTHYWLDEKEKALRGQTPTPGWPPVDS